MSPRRFRIPGTQLRNGQPAASPPAPAARPLPAADTAAAAGPLPAAEPAVIDELPAPYVPPPSSDPADELADRRGRRRQEARERIYAAAMEVFVERSFDAATMDDIAERADVARATVFNHFRRKPEFIAEWALRRRTAAMAGVRRRGLYGHLLPVVLAGYMTELARISTQSRQETVALMGGAIRLPRVLGNSDLAREMAAIVARAQAGGEVRPEVDPAVAGALVAAGYFILVSEWVAVEPEPFGLEGRLLQMVNVVCTGVLEEPWD